MQSLELGTTTRTGKTVSTNSWNIWKEHLKTKTRKNCIIRNRRIKDVTKMRCKQKRHKDRPVTSEDGRLWAAALCGPLGRRQRFADTHSIHLQGRTGSDLIVHVLFPASPLHTWGWRQSGPKRWNLEPSVRGAKTQDKSNQPAMSMHLNLNRRKCVTPSVSWHNKTDMRLVRTRGPSVCSAFLQSAYFIWNYVGTQTLRSSSNEACKRVTAVRTAQHYQRWTNTDGTRSDRAL